MTTATNDFLEFVHERITLGDNQGTFLDYLAAAFGISVERAQDLLKEEIAAGRVLSEDTDLGTLVRRPT